MSIKNTVEKNLGFCEKTSFFFKNLRFHRFRKPLVRRVAGELEAENWRRGRTTVVRGVAGEWEDENWRVGTWSSWGAGS